MFDFQKYEDNIALIEGHQQITFKELEKLITGWKSIVSKIPKGAVVSLLGDFTIHNISMLICLLENKNIVVPLLFANATRFEEGLVDYVVEFKQEWIISKLVSREDHAALRELREKNHGGIILFTSGSSGKEKAVLHDAEELIKNLKVPQSSYRSILFLKFDHIGGLNTLFQLMKSGGTGICTSARDPETIVRIIEREQVSLLSTTSSFIALFLTTNAYRDHNLNSLKMVTFGTEPISPLIIERWKEVLPNIKLFQTYGTTELGIMGIKSKSSATVYMDFKNLEGSYRITEDSILEIKASKSFLGYLNREYHHREWYSTGDRVELKDGQLRIIGRENDWINVGGLKVSPYEVEEVLLSFPGVLETKVSAKEFLLMGQIVVAKVFVNEANQNEEFIHKLKHHCDSILEFHKVPVEIDFYNPIKDVELKKRR